jgi:hypothetical protein
MRHRGTVVVSVAVSLVVILGFAACAIDLGYLLLVRTQAQRTVDAAALAGASAVTEINLSLVNTRSINTALQNPVNGAPVNLDPSKIILGWVDNAFNPVFETDVGKVNAVKVLHSINNVPAFFSGVFGHTDLSINALATAVFNDRVVGFRPPALRDSPLTPFALNIISWEDQKVNGSDNYSFNGKTIINSPDGKPEVQLYVSLQPNGSVGAGNYGLVHVGSTSLGTPEIGDQIEHGIHQNDLYDMNGEEIFSFENNNSYQITGDPGIKGGIESYVNTRIGDVIGFFLYDDLQLGGSNAVFRVVNIKFGRVVHVDIKSPSKQVIIQPEIFLGKEIITGENAPHSGDVGRLVLVR